MRELAPVARGSQDAVSRNLASSFFVHTPFTSLHYVLCWASRHSQGFEDKNLVSSPGLLGHYLVGSYSSGPPAGGTPQILIHGTPNSVILQVRAVGQPIAAIAARDQDTAQRAAKLVKVNYRELPAIVTIEEAIEAASFYPTNIPEIRHGNASEALKSSHHVISGSIRSGAQEHFYLETNAVVAVPNKEKECFIADQKCFVVLFPLTFLAKTYFCDCTDSDVIFVSDETIPIIKYQSNTGNGPLRIMPVSVGHAEGRSRDSGSGDEPSGVQGEEGRRRLRREGDPHTRGLHDLRRGRGKVGPTRADNARQRRGHVDHRAQALLPVQVHNPRYSWLLGGR